MVCFPNNAVVGQFFHQMCMWDGIEGFREIKYCHVYLMFLVILLKEVMDGHDELRLAGMVSAKTMLKERQDVVISMEIEHVRVEQCMASCHAHYS